MHSDIEKILFTESDIQSKVCEIAHRLNAFYGEEEVIMIGVLKGALPFYVDLAKRLTFPVTFDFVQASSYGCGTTSSGTLHISKNIETDICGKHVLLVEDIVDSGNTLSKLLEHLLLQNPKSLKLCCLLDKPSGRMQPIQVDFVGYQTPDNFVVGYGLDYAEHYRNLPYIGVLKPEIYKNR